MKTGTYYIRPLFKQYASPYICKGLSQAEYSDDKKDYRGREEEARASRCKIPDSFSSHIRAFIHTENQITLNSALPLDLALDISIEKI